METPDIVTPTVFKAGLEKAGVMAEDETFMTGFQNLRDLFYGVKPEEEPEATPEPDEAITANMVRSIDKTGEDQYLIGYSSEYAETPEHDTITLAEAKAIFGGMSEDEFRNNVIPYLEGAEADELLRYGARGRRSLAHGIR